MLKIQRHGSEFTVTNPANGKQEEMVNIVFIEEGRSGAQAGLSDSSDFLDLVVGKSTGLSQTRTHTQPVKRATIGDFPVGKTFETGHINRELYTTPQMRGQENVSPRMIDGQPTYFKTWLSDTPKPDVDRRISINIVADKMPELFIGARPSAAQVKITKLVAQPSYAQTSEAVPEAQGTLLTEA